MMYTVEAIQLEVGISRGGLVLFALLSGGDYHKVRHLWYHDVSRCS